MRKGGSSSSYSSWISPTISSSKSSSVTNPTASFPAFLTIAISERWRLSSSKTAATGAFSSTHSGARKISRAQWRLADAGAKISSACAIRSLAATIPTMRAFSSRTGKREWLSRIAVCSVSSKESCSRTATISLCGVITSRTLFSRKSIAPSSKARSSLSKTPSSSAVAKAVRSSVEVTPTEFGAAPRPRTPHFPAHSSGKIKGSSTRIAPLKTRAPRIATVSVRRAAISNGNTSATNKSPTKSAICVAKFQPESALCHTTEIAAVHIVSEVTVRNKSAKRAGFSRSFRVCSARFSLVFVSVEARAASSNSAARARKRVREDALVATSKAVKTASTKVQNKARTRNILNERRVSSFGNRNREVREE